MMSPVTPFAAETTHGLGHGHSQHALAGHRPQRLDIGTSLIRPEPTASNSGDDNSTPETRETHLGQTKGLTGGTMSDTARSSGTPGGAEMPEITATFTSCSCSHSRGGVPSSAPITVPPHPNAREYASALAGTIKAAQVVHARMEQCREWANVVAVAARDAEHADHPMSTSHSAHAGHSKAAGIGNSNPYVGSPNRSIAGNITTMSRFTPCTTGKTVNGPENAGSTGASKNIASNRPHALPPTYSQPKPEPELDTTVDEEPEAYPPTAPAKWYDDPVADARSLSGSRAASRATTPQSSMATSARAGGVALSSLSLHAPSPSEKGGTTAHHASTSMMRSTSAGMASGVHRPSPRSLTPMQVKRPASDGPGDNSHFLPLPKRRSAPASPVAPARPQPLTSTSPRFVSTQLADLSPARPHTSPPSAAETRPRPLLTGTIASRTGPALAHVRAAFASVGVECSPSPPPPRPSP